MLKQLSNFISKLSIVAGMLSLFVLLRVTIVSSLSTTFDIVINYYEKIIFFLLGWLDPIIINWISQLNQMLGLDINIYPHWKYILVLLWVYFVSDVRTSWYQKRKKWAIFAGVWGIFVGLVFSILAGTVPIEGPDQGLEILIFPIVGMVIWQTGRYLMSALLQFPITSTGSRNAAWYRSFSVLFFTYAFPNLLIGFGIIAIALLADTPPDASYNLNFILLVLFIVLVALKAILHGVWSANFRRELEESWKERFRRSGNTKFGTVILTTVVGAFLFLVLNAGLDYVGL